MEFVQEAGQYAGVAAIAGLIVFLPLFLSQARDVRRLRAWSVREPDAVKGAEEAAVAAAKAAQQAVVARATGAADAARREVRQAARDAAAMQSPAERVAADRPATSRITMERMALVRQPAWRRWLSMPSPRQLLAIVAGVFVFGLAVALVALQIAGGGDGGTPAPEPAAEQGGVVKGDIEVAVLNGTAVAGLAAKVGGDVKSNGYELGAVTNSQTPSDETQVFFERGHEEEAKAVARTLGVDSVATVDRESSELANGADVVVIVGEDRADL